jgi:transposase InsO family protein
VAAPSNLTASFAKLACNHRMAEGSNGWGLQIRISTGATHVWKEFPTEALRILLLEEIHLAYHHIGAPKMAHLLGQRYYWPSLASDCSSYVRSCFTCQLCDPSIVFPKWSAMLPLPPGPRHTFAIDMLVDLPKSNTGCLHLILAVCTFSKYVIIEPVCDKTADTAADFFMRRIVSTYGPPVVVQTDNGSEFKGTMDHVLSRHGSLHIRSSPYHSQGNGIAERYIRSVTTLLRRTLTGMPTNLWPQACPTI